MSIRPARVDDADAMAAIYNHYVETSIVTFEEVPVSAQEMALRVEEAHADELPWLVVETLGSVTGFGYASRWKSRCAYRNSVEATVYLHHDARGEGLGSALFGALLDRLAERGLHTVIGGVAQPNPASVALLEKFGFEKVAHFREVGFKLDRWIDVAYWQATLPVR